MGVKQKDEDDWNPASKRRKALSMELKLDVLKRIDTGEKQADVARSHQLSRSTVSTILKDKDRIMDHIKSCKNMQAPIICKRSKIIEEIEDMLRPWIVDLTRRDIPVNRGMIQERALIFYENLTAQTSYQNEPGENVFKASNGWFDNFRKRFNYHYIELKEEAPGADVDAVAVTEDGRIPEETTVKKFSVEKLNEAFALMEKSLSIFEKQDANYERFLKVQQLIHDALTCYSVILHEKKQLNKQSSITPFSEN